MPFNGTGTFARNYNWVNDAANGIVITAARMDADANDLASGLSNCITRDGQGKPTAAIDWNGQTLSNVSALTLTGVALAVSEASNKAAPSSWIQARIQNGDTVYASDTGAANAYVVTLTPALSAYTNGQSLSFKAANACTGASTVNFGPSVLNIKRLDGSDVTAGDIVAGQIVKGTVDGTTFWLQNPAAALATQFAVLGTRRNLALSADGVAAAVSISFDELMLEDGSNRYKVVRSGALSINTTTTGANGLDTGVLAASTWYAVWVISNGTTTAGLISTSSASPTLPTGYTFKARVGWIRTDGTASKIPLSFKQYGDRVIYAVAAGSNVASAISMITGGSGVFGSSLTAIAVAAFIPPTATRIIGAIYQDSTGNKTVTVQASPNSVATVPGGPGVFLQQSVNTTYSNQQVQFDFLLESASIYYASSTGGGSTGMLVFGWVDNI